MQEDKWYQGWRTYLAGVTLIVVGIFMFWWSGRPSLNPTAVVFLQGQAMLAIPAGLGFIGIRSKQARIAADLKETQRLPQPMEPPKGN